MVALWSHSRVLQRHPGCITVPAGGGQRRNNGCTRPTFDRRSIRVDTAPRTRAHRDRHARILVSALIDRPLVQRQGLDTVGAPAESDEKPISAEVVDGEREELYWNKVPEKVRREAVRKGIAQAGGVPAGGEDGTGEGQQQQEGKRPRKRRRKA